MHSVQSRVSSGQLCGRWGGLGLLLGRGKEHLALVFTEALCRLLGTPTKEDTNQDVWGIDYSAQRNSVLRDSGQGWGGACIPGLGEHWTPVVRDASSAGPTQACNHPLLSPSVFLGPGSYERTQCALHKPGCSSMNLRPPWAAVALRRHFLFSLGIPLCWYAAGL